MDEVKEKVSVRINLPRGGVPATDLGKLLTTLGETMPNFEVVVSLSTSSAPATN